MAAYNGVEVTFLGNNKVRVTWENIGGGIIFKKKPGFTKQFSPKIEVISGRVNTAGSPGLVTLVKGGGEIVLTYPSDVNLTAIGYSSNVPDFANWIRMYGVEADAEFDAKSEYIWEQAEPLSTPTGLYADNITSDSATTHWTGDANASNYKVQYKAAGDTVWTETYTD